MPERADALEPELDRPAFVIGTGRCGLSPLMDLVAFHRELAWPSQWNARFPAQLWLAGLSRLTGTPPFEGSLKFQLGRVVPRPTETFALWNRVFPGFGRPVRDLGAADVTRHVRSGFRRVVAEILRHAGKRRFIAEYSGWSRVRFLREIFPRAQFIHIVRDGRAVAHSLIHVDYWLGWQGVGQWRWGPLPPEWMEQLARYDHSFLGLAALQWKRLVRNLVERTGELPTGDAHQVRYEDLVAAPEKTARECAAFLGLDPDCPRFRRHLASVRIVDANSRTLRIPSWRENLRPEQVRMLDDLLGEELASFGYLPAAPGERP